MNFQVESQLTSKRDRCIECPDFLGIVIGEDAQIKRVIFVRVDSIDGLHLDDLVGVVVVQGARRDWLRIELPARQADLFFAVHHVAVRFPFLLRARVCRERTTKFGYFFIEKFV